MSNVLDRHTFVEFREDPSGFERYGLTRENAYHDSVNSPTLVHAHVVAFRTRKCQPWLSAVSGSVHMLGRPTWERMAIVEDPLAL